VIEPDRFAAEVQDELLDLGPDNYFTIRPLLGRDAPPAIETLLASLRLSRFDPSMFIELLPGLLEVLPSVPDGTRNEVGRVLVQVWDNYFSIGEPIDLGLCVGLAFSAMERYPEAVEFLDISVKEHPESPAAAFAMAVARRGLRDLGAAAEWTARALTLQPGFSEARALRAILADELAGAGH
jgi:tetratricopeptide (TPR) repeat protein